MRFLLILLFLNASHVLAETKTWVEKDTWVSKYLEAGGQLWHVTGLKEPDNWQTLTVWDNTIRTATMPASFNWNDFRKLQPIRNQKSCGSCWAFSVTAVVESLHRIVYPELTPMIDLAEQQVLSCSGAGSCGGGYFNAFNFTSNGIGNEKDFPYQARDLRCKTIPAVTKITGWKYIGDPNKGATTEQLKQAIVEHGPISVTVNGSGNFQRYSSGVFNSCGSTSTNHMVTLEGWVDDAKYKDYGGGYWIMRNSWGESWGEKGYMKIVYQSKGGSKCNGIAETAAYAVMGNIDSLRTYFGILD